MKKTLILLAILMVALIAVYSATAYDEVDNTVGGAYPGPAAMDKTLVFSGEYDFSLATYDTNDIVKLVNVPAGVMIDKIVVSATDLNQTITNTLYTYTTAWAAEGDANTFSKTTDASVVYYMALPAITATGPESTNLTVTVVDQAAVSVAQTSWGFIATAGTTNGIPTIGKLRISVFGVDVLPGTR